MSRIQKFRMFNPGTSSYMPANPSISSFNPMSSSFNSFQSLPRMGSGYNRIASMQTPPTIRRAFMNQAAPKVSAPQVSLVSGDSKRSISGDTFRFAKGSTSKKKKEPLCECGMPISQCKCDGHNHKLKDAKTKKISTMRKSAPPDYKSIFGSAVQGYANRLNENQRKYTPPPLYQQTFGATVNIGDDGGLSGYTSFYKPQKGSKSSTMRKNMCKCGSGMNKNMCKCGSGMNKNFAKLKIKSKKPNVRFSNRGYRVNRRVVQPEVIASNNLLESLLTNPTVVSANRYTQQKLIPQAKQFTTQVIIPAAKKFTSQVLVPASQRAMQSAGSMARSAQRKASIGIYQTRKATRRAKDRALANFGDVINTKVQPAVNRFAEANINPIVNRILDASLKDIAMSPITATKAVTSGVRQIPDALRTSARTSRNAVLAGKIYGKQFADEVVSSMRKKPDALTYAIVGRTPENRLARKLRNTIIAGKLYGKDYATQIGNMSLREALKPASNLSRKAIEGYKNLTPRQKKALLAGLGVAGASAYAYNQFNKRDAIKKSITPMGNRVIGGYSGNRISKSVKSSQTNLSNKYVR